MSLLPACPHVPRTTQEQGLPAGSGIFVVCDATNGAPLAIFQENRFLTDLRTGAAGAVSVKHFAARHHKKVGFVGAGVIAAAMARGSKCVHEFDEGFAYGLDPAKTQVWADEIEAELGYKVHVCKTAEECVRQSDVVFTQTPGSETVCVSFLFCLLKENQSHSKTGT